MRTVDPQDGRRGRFTTAGLCVLIFVTILTSCAYPAPPPTPVDLRLNDPKVAAFLKDCETGVKQWTSGQVDYPRLLTLRMGSSTSYVAAIDIRTDPRPPEDVLLTDEARGELVAIQCVVGARLVPVGDAIEVDSEEWVVREFTPVGLINWAWSIKGVAPGDHQVKLLLHPTLSTQDGELALTGTKTATFVTTVRVEASAIQIVDRWFKDNWHIITGIAVLLGGAFLAVVKWAGNVIEALRDLRAKFGKKAPTQTPVRANPPDGRARRTRRTHAKRDPNNPS